VSSKVSRQRSARKKSTPVQSQPQPRAVNTQALESAPSIAQPTPIKAKRSDAFDAAQTVATMATQDMIEALGSVSRVLPDDGLFTRIYSLGDNDIASGTLRTLAALTAVMKVVPKHEQIGIDGGPTVAEWDRVGWFMQELAEVAAEISDRIANERSRRERDTAVAS
jgi:hypothetical protein